MLFKVELSFTQVYCEKLKVNNLRSFRCLSILIKLLSSTRCKQVTRYHCFFNFIFTGLDSEMLKFIYMVTIIIYIKLELQLIGSSPDSHILCVCDTIMIPNNF